MTECSRAMGSIQASHPVIVEDPDDPDDIPCSSHTINIDTNSGPEPDVASASATLPAESSVSPVTAELSMLDEKFSLLLAAHSREAAAVSARMDALEALKLGELMAEAARSCADSAAAATAAMSAAKQVMSAISDPDFIQSELEERTLPPPPPSPPLCHDRSISACSDARHAALAIRDVVISASAEAAAAVSNDVKKAAWKKR